MGGFKDKDFGLLTVSLNVKIANFLISSAIWVGLYPDSNANQFGYIV